MAAAAAKKNDEDEGSGKKSFMQILAIQILVSN